MRSELRAAPDQRVGMPRGNGLKRSDRGLVEHLCEADADATEVPGCTARVCFGAVGFGAVGFVTTSKTSQRGRNQTAAHSILQEGRNGGMTDCMGRYGY